MATRSINSTRFYLFLTVFIAGMCTLAIEFTTSRMIQSVYGTSNIVWANVIGLVLLSLTLGYFIGGRLADRWPYPALFYLLVSLAGFCAALFLLLTSVILRQAAAALPCPVIANGHVHDAAQAQEVLAATGARGLMIGRGAIRNPWLFDQIRRQLRGAPVPLPTGRDVAGYIRALWESQACPGKPERTQCERMKKVLNYIGEGVPAPFLHQIRRTQTAADFHRICDESLDHDEPMRLPPAEAAAVA